MPITLPKISKQVLSKDIHYTLSKNFTSIQHLWVPLQMRWMMLLEKKITTAM